MQFGLTRQSSKFSRAERQRELIDPILPLINVVFLLLIFVMLMSRVENVVNHDISPTISESDDPAGTRKSLVVLKADGSVHIEGVEMNDQALLFYAKDHRRLSAIEEIKIKADARVDATRLIDIMKILRSGGVDHLVLLTEKRR